MESFFLRRCVESEKEQMSPEKGREENKTIWWCLGQRETLQQFLARIQKFQDPCFPVSVYIVSSIVKLLQSLRSGTATLLPTCARCSKTTGGFPKTFWGPLNISLCVLCCRFLRLADFLVWFGFAWVQARMPFSFDHKLAHNSEKAP